MAIVQRLPGDKPGDTIVSALLKTDRAQIERGRNEINKNSTDMVLVTGGVVESTFLRPGLIVEVQDKSGSRRGRVTTFSLSGDATTVSTNIVVECVK